MTTVFVVGTGCETGAWEPVTRAINSVAPEVPVQAGNADQANFWMAKLAALRRANHAVSGQVGPSAKAYSEPLHVRLRQALCQTVSVAQRSGALKLRDSIKHVFADARWGADKVILTTNWDLALEEAFGNAVVHIHGSTNDWQSLYLPSDYAFDPAHDEATRQRMYVEQDRAIRTLWNAERICIFGLSLDPLDAELALIVHTGLQNSGSLVELCICNLPSEETKLRNRVGLLGPPEVQRVVRFQAV